MKSLKNKALILLCISWFPLVTCSTLKKGILHPPQSAIIQEKSEDIRITEYVIDNIKSEKVLSFYDSLTGSRKITIAILQNAREWNVPINFAFALAKKESEFNPHCENYNEWNDSWDRGLFQLNDKSFVLTEEEYFNPDINAHKGLQYFHQQLLTFGDTYLAMLAYNWGPNRVKAGRTPPKKVVDYIEDIKNYEKEYNYLFFAKFGKI